MRLAVKDSNHAFVDQHNSSGANFLALRDLFSRLKTDSEINVLDVGVAWNSNIQFFSKFRSRLFIENLYLFLQKARRKDPKTTIVDQLQSYPEGTQFDVLLFWDIFDYLKQEDINDLVAHVSQYCKKGSLLFFVTSTMDNIPAEPALFKIIDEDHLHFETTTRETKKGKNYRQAGISKLLPKFRLIRAFRMSTGMEENLFIFDDK